MGGLSRFIALLCAAAALMWNGVALAQSEGRCLVEAARKQVGVTLHYDPDYRRIAYPMGDVPPERGVCTDVLVRTYRNFDVDLQVLVHEDMRRSWSRYPKLWGLSRPDSNIDHRRVPNLETFFGTHGEVLPVSRDAAAYRPGDIVTWRLGGRVPHIGLVSDQRSPAGVPLVIHNIGFGTVEEDMLFAHPIIGHYRYRPAALRSRCPD